MDAKSGAGIGIYRETVLTLDRRNVKTIDYYLFFGSKFVLTRIIKLTFFKIPTKTGIIFVFYKIMLRQFIKKCEFCVLIPTRYTKCHTFGVCILILTVKNPL